ncbi:MAG: alpha/beta hydrolase [Alphaproteobacteria bacterium]|nr:alpha/beta hydrolase [Alphaproteobacteria bacterium]
MASPVVMIHGAFCAGWAFDEYRSLFEAHGVRVLAPTLRHHDTAPGARASRELGVTSVLDYAADIEAIVRELKEPPVLIGHSMGGLIAQIVATRLPVKALALLAPSAPWGILPTSPWEVASAQGLYFAGQFWNKPLRPEAWIAESHALDQLPAAQREAVFARFVPESGLATFEIMQWALDVRRASYVDASQITCPVLCVAGEFDRVNPPKTVAAIAKRHRERGHYHQVDGASHWLIGEPGWEKTARYVHAWLNDVTVAA